MLHKVVGGVHLVSEDPENLYMHQIALQFHVVGDDEREREHVPHKKTRLSFPCIPILGIWIFWRSKTDRVMAQKIVAQKDAFELHKILPHTKSSRGFRLESVNRLSDNIGADQWTPTFRLVFSTWICFRMCTCSEIKTQKIICLSWWWVGTTLLLECTNSVN